MRVYQTTADRSIRQGTGCLYQALSSSVPSFSVSCLDPTDTMEFCRLSIDGAPGVRLTSWNLVTSFKFSAHAHAPYAKGRGVGVASVDDSQREEDGVVEGGPDRCVACVYALDDDFIVVHGHSKLCDQNTPT